MNLHATAVGSGYLGAALGVAMVVPQIVRTLRDRSMPGVSALSWALTALSSTTWMLYGIRTGEIPQIPGNVLLVTGAVVVVLIVPSGTSTLARAAGLAAPVLVIGGLSIVAPPPLIGFFAFGVALISAVPQTIKSLSRRAPGESAVSLLAWLLRAASQVCWLAYAIVVRDVTVTIAAVFILTSALVVVAGEVGRRALRPNVVAAPGAECVAV
jgi:uncharacterized protein with PQ loop repeat